LIITQLVLLLILGLGVYVLFPVVDIFIIVAIGGVLNWMARTLISDRVMKVVMKRRQIQTQFLVAG